jgi:hypothetical protein
MPNHGSSSGTYAGPNSGTNSWDNATYWAGALPGSSTPVTISEAGTYTVQILASDPAYTIGSLTMNDPTATLLLAGSLTSDGDAQISNGTVDVAGGAFSVKGGLLLSNTGQVNVLSGSVHVSNDITLSNSSDLAISGGTFSQTGNVNVQDSATLTIAGGSYSSSGALSVSGSANLIIAAGTVSQTGSMQVQNTASVTISGGTFTSPNGLQLADDTKLTVSGGSLNLTSSSGLQLGSNSVVNISNGAAVDVGQISGGSAASVVNVSGGSLTVANSDTGQATYNLSNGATITYDGTLVNNTNVYNFATTGAGSTIVVAGSNVTSINAQINGLGGSNSIAIPGITFTPTDKISTSGGNTVITTSTGQVLFTFTGYVAPTNSQLTTNSSGQLVVSTAPCFVNGTLIATPTGGALVEDIAPGDNIVTADGRVRPVKWVGFRHINLRGHRNLPKAAPIRIVRGAFGKRRPARDLLVSPDHAIWIAADRIADATDEVHAAGGVLIPAEVLVNSATIFQDTSLSELTYYHIELDSQDVLLAEELTVESYLDTGNRGLFANAGLPTILHAEFAVNAATKERATSGCAPLLLDGAVVASVKRALLKRAETAFGVRHVTDPDLRIVVNGRRLAPLTTTGGIYRFALPRGASSFRIVSRASAPSDVLPTPADRRVLGVAIADITLGGPDGTMTMPIDHPALNAGWHAIEAGQAVRWTDGDAVVPFPADLVDIRVAMTLPYRDTTQSHFAIAA